MMLIGGLGRGIIFVLKCQDLLRAGCPVIIIAWLVPLLCLLTIFIYVIVLIAFYVFDHTSRSLLCSRPLFYFRPRSRSLVHRIIK